MVSISELGFNDGSSACRGSAEQLPYVFYAFCWNTESVLRPYLADSLGLSRQQVTAFYSLQAFGALIGVP